jgi:regulatory protein
VSDENGTQAQEVRDPEHEAALLAGLGALGRRDRTVAELRGWLADRGAPEEAIEAAIAELIEIGELNDERYAEFFCADKRDLAGWGPERISATLADRGVDPRLIERYVHEERESQVERARALVITRNDDLSEDAGRARSLAFLNRRGFDYEVAYDAIRAAQRDRPAAA